MTVSLRRRCPESFFNFSNRLQAYERNRKCVLISVCRSVSFCNKIKVASCICVSAKLVRMRIIAVAAPWLQSVLESRLTYFMTVK